MQRYSIARQPLVKQAKHRIVLGESLLRGQREVVVDEGGVDPSLDRRSASRTSPLTLVSGQGFERERHGVDRHRTAAV